MTRGWRRLMAGTVMAILLAGALGVRSARTRLA
jgi:hypothetical protein